ncbi:uncharacterized protein EV420DRAFT_1490890 [Desarmillaria tabescens]|uniref:Uncharacterized protein n=1 Tax=Armillaria tabescens TaxID=1929756 RepID=A0AA39IVN6_ARMTA|nr:uncharacterized protein EV420DRAFT_1490890 [Desarmillaria tabescens]KAK0431303.1 hypothetical protein EV420DRAFT_1490890 [Desarmillaria tabescens]
MRRILRAQIGTTSSQRFRPRGCHPVTRLTLLPLPPPPSTSRSGLFAVLVVALHPDPVLSQDMASYCWSFTGKLMRRLADMRLQIENAANTSLGIPFEQKDIWISENVYSCSIRRLGIASGVVMVVFAIVPAGFYFGYLFRYIYLDVGKHG